MTPLHRALRTYRWHADPILGRLLQTNADHAGGMCALAIDLWPDASADLLKACILHDAAECVTGDMPRLAKKDFPDLGRHIAEIEDCVNEENGWMIQTDTEDTARLDFLDNLEPYLFVKLHDPARLATAEWPEARKWLIARAADLGISDRLAVVMEAGA